MPKHEGVAFGPDFCEACDGHGPCAEHEAIYKRWWQAVHDAEVRFMEKLKAKLAEQPETKVGVGPK